MARAEVASASVNSNSIKGLAQSIAKPAYRRLLTAEPALRRAVPALIIAFLLTICVGAIVQVVDHRRQAIGELMKQIEGSADFLADRLDRIEQSRADKPGSDRRLQTELERMIPSWARAAGRQVLVANGDGVVVAGVRHEVVANADGTTIATAPLEAGFVGRRLIDILGPTQPLTTFGAAAGVLEIPLSDGSLAYGTVRSLFATNGELAILHGRAEALTPWVSDTTLTITLSATTGFVVLILGFAFHWQATRAREADVIYETVRSRIDTALNRGRCGLWDWDLARGRVFWSHSMFAILGLKPRDALMSFGELNALVHPEDIDLYELAAQLADAKATLVDHAFRMRHANGNWVWLRARCELVQQSGEGGPHLIGIAVDITEQKTLVERTVEADLRLRDAIETIPEAFVVWDAQNRLVLCNSNFQELHNLPDEAIAAGSLLRVRGRGRPQAGRALQGHQRGPVTGRAHLRGAARRRPLAAHQRAPHQGRRLRLGRHRHHQHQAARRKADGKREAPDGDRRRPAQLAAEARAAGRGGRRSRREICRGEDPCRRGEPGQVEIPRQYEPRAAHAAQRHHRLLRDHGIRRCSARWARTSTANTARDIHQSGQYLLDVINDILDMSKIEAGRIRLDPERLELEPFLNDAMRVVSGRADDKQLTLTARIGTGIRLSADPRLLKQIMLNLLSNAVKFTPEGGRITIRARAARGCVSIAIADTGIGIPEDALTRLGRPFEQVESQLTKSHQGSGLGLAIAKSLVELHRGSMRIRSTPGRGTMVLLRLPIDGRAAQRDFAEAAA